MIPKPGWMGLLAALLIAPAAGAQLDFRPEHPGSWKYSAARERNEPKLSAAERSIVLAQLRAIGDVVATLPMLRPPRGVEIVARERIDMGCPDEERLCRFGSIPAWTEVSVMGLHVNGGLVVPKREEPPGFSIGVNDPTMATFDRGFDFERLYDEGGNEIVLAPMELERLSGASVYENNVVFLERPGSPLFVAITREGLLRALMKRHAAQRIVVDILAAELSAMSASERREQAVIGPSESPSRLVPNGTADSAPLVIVNPGYFDRALPKTAVQLITLRFMYGNRYLSENPAPPHYGPDAIRTWEIRQAIDYATLRKLIARRAP